MRKNCTALAAYNSADRPTNAARANTRTDKNANDIMKGSPHHWKAIVNCIQNKPQPEKYFSLGNQILQRYCYICQTRSLDVVWLSWNVHVYLILTTWRQNGTLQIRTPSQDYVYYNRPLFCIKEHQLDVRGIADRHWVLHYLTYLYVDANW